MFDDDVNVPAGNIVGGNGKSGALYYEGRIQGQVVHEESEEKLIRRLTDDLRRKVADCGASVNYIYPNNDSWKIKIFN